MSHNEVMCPVCVKFRKTVRECPSQQLRDRAQAKWIAHIRKVERR